MLNLISIQNNPETIYLGLALFCTGWFLIQFLISTIWGELDLDANSELDIGSVISFKGLIHFGIGYSWWMYLHASDIKWNTHACAFILGILFMIVLFIVYWITSKFKKEIIQEKGNELVGRNAEIYLDLNGDGKDYIVYTKINGVIRELQVKNKSEKKYSVGSIVIICSYKNGIYYIN